MQPSYSTLSRPPEGGGFTDPLWGTLNFELELVWHPSGEQLTISPWPTALWTVVAAGAQRRVFDARGAAMALAMVKLAVSRVAYAALIFSRQSHESDLEPTGNQECNRCLA